MECAHQVHYFVNVIAPWISLDESLWSTVWNSRDGPNHKETHGLKFHGRVTGYYNHYI